MFENFDPGWKKIAFTRCFKHNFTPGQNLAPVFKTGVNSPRGEISAHLLCVNAMKTLIKDRGELSPGRDFTCKRALIKKKKKKKKNHFRTQMARAVIVFTCLLIT